MKAHPGPIVSGSHFFPAAPLLCTKLMPACLVMSRKRTCALTVHTNAAQIISEERKTRRTQFMGLFIGPGLPCLRCAWQPQSAWLEQVALRRVHGPLGVRCCPRDAAGDMGR